MPLSTIIFIIFLAAAVLASYKSKKLTAYGAVTGGMVAVLIWLGSGIAGIAQLGVFFVLSVLATSHKKQYKSSLQTQTHEQIRNSWQVLANGGIAAICGVFAYLFLANAPVFQLMMAGAFASALADTLSSELGSVYGKRFYNIITSKPDERGKDGVVSVEGILIGLAGSAVIAAVYSFYYGFNTVFFIILIAGTAGNLIDSILGATLERRGIIGNNTVNVLNTFAAAIIVWLLYML
ncbi:DUF92 domain-containing protein [Mucilaginibacter conchicola]|uniref:DUF92 domain-containing protein n=1 Tax=Mucilaginibacter conchicola TaxID=2303333 RepID=A0A372NW20_9SPHI|nr:DUF92 domain-containing protein [Mucilaginibacter conchicola]RFZ94295.1 DUF92 domain-containing protein [Mucilaginibacter conchicola]